MARFLAALALTGSLTFLFAAPPRPVRRAGGSAAASSRPVSPASAAAWAQRTAHGMTLSDLVAQLMMIQCYGDNPSSDSKEFRDFAHLVKDTHVGGIIMINRAVLGQIKNAEPYAFATFLNRMQRLAPLPLLVGGDFERGASMRVSGTAKYPHNMAFTAARDLSLTRYEGLATAREARSLGVHWIFAPDADVNNNPDNPVINTRSYGEDPQAVSEQVRAYILGAHSDPRSMVLTTAKHFPGHGDTAVDSHMGLGTVTASRERLNSVELPPFRAAIQAGVDAIMTAHLSVPSIEPQPIPATVSPKVLTDLLQRELGFKGLVVTDAMDMQGLSSQFPAGEAAIRALEAGADVLLMPLNPDQTLRAVVAAVQQRRLTRTRIEMSVRKILEAKMRLGLMSNRVVNLEEMADVIDAADAAKKAQEVADKSVTLVRNDRDVMPLRASAPPPCVFVLAESRYGQGGRVMMEELRRRKAQAVSLDPAMSATELTQAAQQAAQCSTIAVMAFVSASAYRGNVALPGNLTGFLETISKGSVPVILFSMGNPYLLRNFPNVTGYAALYSTAPTAEVAAVKALFGEIAIGGRLPISIPGLAKVGDGISVPAVMNH